MLLTIRGWVSLGQLKGATLRSSYSRLTIRLRSYYKPVCLLYKFICKSVLSRSFGIMRLNVELLHLMNRNISKYIIANYSKE